MSASRGRAVLGLASLALVALLTACDDDDASTPTTTTTPFTATACASQTPTLRVDLIDDAIAAVERERGGPQRYYEINATESLVNLFVAGDETGEETGDQTGEVVPYTYVGGELSAQDPQTGAQGSTFEAARVQFDPSKVTSCVGAALPDATIQAFDVLGGPGGAVQYSIIARSQVGGQLVAVVDAQGNVQSVEAVDS